VKDAARRVRRGQDRSEMAEQLADADDEPEQS
jgi:hypothetical protein